MHEHFTDAENTGAPLVPMVERPEEVVPDDDRETEREEVVLSHRLQR